MTQKAQSEIRRLTGYALCRRLREAAEGMSSEQNQALMRRAADVIEETHTELQLAEVARLLFNALGKYATETEKEIARTAFVSFSEQQAKKTACTMAQKTPDTERKAR